MPNRNLQSITDLYTEVSAFMDTARKLANPEIDYDELHRSAKEQKFCPRVPSLTDVASLNEEESQQIHTLESDMGDMAARACQDGQISDEQFSAMKIMGMQKINTASVGLVRKFGMAAVAGMMPATLKSPQRLEMLGEYGLINLKTIATWKP